MDLIVDTDCGHDPDDFFTLCYLVAAGVDIRCIAVTPGDLDQLAVVRLFCEQVGLDILIGSSKSSEKYSSGSVHHALLKMYGKPRHGTSDGPGKDVIRDTLSRYPDSELFIIGPPSSVGRFLTENVSGRSKPATEGRFKIGHFEETTIRFVDCRAAPALPEVHYGESTPNGRHRHHSHPACARLV